MAEIFFVMFRMSMQASILILAVIVFRACFKSYPRSYTYCLWLLVYLRLLCPVFIESSFSLLPESAKFTQENLGTGIQDYGEGGSESVKLYEAAGQIQTGQDDKVYLEKKDFSTQEDSAAAYTKSEAVQRFLLYGWICGSLVMALFYGLQLIRIKKKVALAVHTEGNVWECENINSPFAMGILSPRIYMPYGIEGKQREYILLHERMHIRHLDALVKWIGSAILCLYWWNPLVWTASYMMNDDMEMVCDERVLKSADMEMRKEYANTLLDFSMKRSMVLTGIFFGESHTEGRIRHILKHQKPGLLLSILLVFGMIACAICFLTVPKKAALLEENIKDENAPFTQLQEKVPAKENDGFEEEIKNRGESDGREELFKVMDRIVSEEAEVITFSENFHRMEEADRRVLLAELPERKLTAYGCISPEFGSMGIILDWNGNCTYLEEAWATQYGEARLFMADYDKDGRDEVAFSFLWGTGTGLYIEKLFVLETYETGHMEAYEFTEEEQLAEIENLLLWEADEEKQEVYIREKGSGRLIQTLSYAEAAETEENLTVTGIGYLALVRFLPGEEIMMNIKAGMALNDWVVLQYDTVNGEKSLNFPVSYDYSNGQGRGYFSLNTPSSSG